MVSAKQLSNVATGVKSAKVTRRLKRSQPTGTEMKASAHLREIGNDRNVAAAAMCSKLSGNGYWRLADRRTLQMAGWLIIGWRKPVNAGHL